MQRDIQNILAEYEKEISLYSIFKEKMEQLVKEIINENNLRVHSITSRLKEKTSLISKLERRESKYTKLSDITDIVGIRVITYFSDEVDIVAKKIEEEFEIDKENSIDVRKLLDPDRFGYLSLHYIVKLDSYRKKLTEYERYSQMKAEIQIRSILQHTWAEIEHDLGYKNPDVIPRKVRRSFSRLAGLLELADIEFSRIRDSLMDYKQQIQGVINDGPKSMYISLDQTSLGEFINKNVLVRELDDKISRIVGAELVYDQKITSRDVQMLDYVGFKTLGELHLTLEKNSDLIIRFAEKFLKDSNYDKISSGISIFYLCYIELSRTESMEKLKNYLTYFDIGLSEDKASISETIYSIYKESL